MKSLSALVRAQARYCSDFGQVFLSKCFVWDLIADSDRSSCCLGTVDWLRLHLRAPFFPVVLFLNAMLFLTAMIFIQFYLSQCDAFCCSSAILRDLLKETLYFLMIYLPFADFT